MDGPHMQVQMRLDEAHVHPLVVVHADDDKRELLASVNSSPDAAYHSKTVVFKPEIRSESSPAKLSVSSHGKHCRSRFSPSCNWTITSYIYCASRLRSHKSGKPLAVLNLIYLGACVLHWDSNRVQTLVEHLRTGNSPSLASAPSAGPGATSSAPRLCAADHAFPRNS